jgi:hypothetical protein
MDTHERVRAITMDGVTRAYEQSLEVQGRHGARYLKMWVHQGAGDHGVMYCLVEAPNREAVVLVHLDAHGLLPNEIHEVVEAPQEILPGHHLRAEQRSAVHA